MRNLKSLDARVTALESGAPMGNCLLRPNLVGLSDDELDQLEAAMRQLEGEGAQSLTDEDLRLIQRIEWTPVEQVT
ncbi:hypothetical protein P8Q88_10170 [Qipengyuania sp. XHP0207]|uniref:hypothetical protein n=1 Tax=Qipengyuania sp. XHP0207 TaxID=3038078 RepID=UPI00241E2AD6|nr:hypothetical protein [Qipengyuania sp. XHP0207]MDG5748543.1 hypothetical protein [Qipengyuania sp. XHP0207]